MRSQSLGKLGAWFLLMIISYVLVALVNRPQAMPVAERSAIGTLDKMVPAAMTVYSGS